MFWHYCFLEDSNIKISCAHHTRKSPWWLSPKKMEEIRCATVPSLPEQKFSLLLASPVVSSPAASSPLLSVLLQQFFLSSLTNQTVIWTGTHSQMLWLLCLQRAPSHPFLSPPLTAPETPVATPSLLLSLWRNRWLLAGMCLLIHLKDQKSIKNRQTLSKSYSAPVQNSYLMWGLFQRWSGTPALLGLIKLDTHTTYKRLCLCTWTAHLCPELHMPESRSGGGEKC